jgi:hypothetical protein
MHIERSIEIQAPRELVWQLVHDPASRAGWDVRVAELIIEGEQVPGAPATIVWRTPIARCVSEAEITCFDVPQRSAMAIDEASLAIFPPGERIFCFEQTKKGTRVITRYEIDTDAEHRAPGLLVRMLINRDIKRSLKNLRRLALAQVAEYAAAAPHRGPIAESL